VDNKSADIVKSIKSKEDNFRVYFEYNLDDETSQFINKLKQHTSLYLFSGIIRDFFLAKNEVFRDIDLIYDIDINLENIFPKYNFEKNSFGGYKVHIGKYIIDIWNLNETWGLKKGQLTLEFNKLHKLPDTTFFNFSSIIYSLKENEFIIGKPFLNFLKKEEIDIVLDDNPYPELCIINTIYYQKKLNYKLSKRLKNYILHTIEELSPSKLLNIQIKHFNKIMFTKDEIFSFRDKLEM